MIVKDLFSTAKEKIAQRGKSVKWRLLYNTLHKIDSCDNMGALSVILNANIMARLVKLGGKRHERFANELDNDFFEAIYQTNNESNVFNYNPNDTESNKKFLYQVLTKLHKIKSATNPENKNSLRAVKFLSINETKAKNLKNCAIYNIFGQYIGFFPVSLRRTTFERFMQAPKHEYIHVLQKTYNSSLGRAALKLEIRYPILTHFFVPYKKRLEEQEARIAGNDSVKNIENRFMQFLMDKNNQSVISL